VRQTSFVRELPHNVLWIPPLAWIGGHTWHIDYVGS
jgi:hypothetical protein